ncbi:hypothetical protein DPM19_25970 [Actinomadura craniellae]|uniref:SseB protein N-terminal domain-containing protein n=1 Tax=Actinomadura craniellae TaxID=2231787 RepID=A0A365GZA7_9ACTN|nr:hypothetical protein DPM19_25970 [Actinomadura craniellae]
MIVPVRESREGALSLMTARLDAGNERVGLAFTGEPRLREALGDGLRWIRLSEPALRAMLRPLGITRIQVDALLVAPRLPVAPAPALATR